MMVTKTQIADEMDKLEKIGLEPSADRLLQRTGGSKTKVLELRNEVRAERDALERTGADLPESVRAIAFDLVRSTQKTLEDAHASAVNVMLRRASALADENESLERDLAEAKSAASSAESRCDHLQRENEQLRARIIAVSTEMKAITQSAVDNRSERANAGSSPTASMSISSQTASDERASESRSRPSPPAPADTVPVSSFEVPKVRPAASAVDRADVNANSVHAADVMLPTQIDLEEAIANHHTDEREKAGDTRNEVSSSTSSMPNTRRSILEQNRSSSAFHSPSAETPNPPRNLKIPSFLQREGNGTVEHSGEKRFGNV
ncbi:DNA-binding protein [Aurantimonas sp. A2-1-M11]|uniref:DNA-binding protein n=1 Tax=Aurantimonas sp. A2-1-M11 TaxID=3113712 RepID=UPI002F94FD28